MLIAGVFMALVVMIVGSSLSIAKIQIFRIKVTHRCRLAKKVIPIRSCPFSQFQ
jgi:hypothetical protein